MFLFRPVFKFTETNTNTVLRIVSGKEGMPLWSKLQSRQSWLSPSGDGDLLEPPPPPPAGLNYRDTTQHVTGFWCSQQFWRNVGGVKPLLGEDGRR